jgi:signal recognition particle subunit SRP54
MGDVMSLIEEVEQKVDHKKAEQLAKKVSQGKRFDLNDTLRKLANTCARVGGWWKDVPLLKRYDRFLKTKTNLPWIDQK